MKTIASFLFMLIVSFACGQAPSPLLEAIMQQSRPPLTASTPDTNTVLLLHFDKTDGDACMPDTSGKGHTVTSYWGTATTNAIEKKFGTGSLDTGANGSIGISGDADFYFGAENFTIDCWVRFVTIINPGRIWDYKTSLVDEMLYYQKEGTNNYVAWESEAQAYYLAGGGPAATGVWTHIAFVRDSGVVNLYIGGTNVASFDYTTNPIGDSSVDFVIGAYGFAADAGMNGQIDEFRISHGIARYTNDFTPSTEAYPDP